MKLKDKLKDICEYFLSDRSRKYIPLIIDKLIEHANLGEKCCYYMFKGNFEEEYKQYKQLNKSEIEWNVLLGILPNDIYKTIQYFQNEDILVTVKTFNRSELVLKFYYY